jgi:DNA-binding response OmpR family regulator
MDHILVVDDEPAIVTVVRERLEREGFQVRAVASGEEALVHLDVDPADLVVLDVMLPGMDGFEVLRHLRGAGDTVPVILLTARDEDVDKIVGLELGADDYLVKPFNPRELSARIRALLRRQAEVKALEARLASEARGASVEGRIPGALEESGPIEVEGLVPPALRPAQGGALGPQAQASKAGGPVPSKAEGLVFDHSQRRAWFRDKPLTLRPKEYELLRFLAQHPGQVFTREVLLSHVWGQESFIDERTVDVHVRRMRAKLADIDPDVQVVLTVWGVGYRLAEDI